MFLWRPFRLHLYRCLAALGFLSLSLPHRLESRHPSILAVVSCLYTVRLPGAVEFHGEMSIWEKALEMLQPIVAQLALPTQQPHPWCSWELSQTVGGQSHMWVDREPQDIHIAFLGSLTYLGLGPSWPVLGLSSHTHLFAPAAFPPPTPPHPLSPAAGRVETMQLNLHSEHS